MPAKDRKGSARRADAPRRARHQPELDGLGLGAAPPKHVKTLTSSVTTAWGVDWDEVYIARDLMQNFFDSNRTRISEIKVEIDGLDVVISAPTPFNLERLFYLGSEKDESDVGQYGEGFKVAATCLLRDHGVTPIAQSGSDLLLLRIADEAVQGTGLFPVQYDFYRTARTFEGTRLVLRGSSKKLAKAIKDGLTHFFYEGNPLFGMKRWVKADESVAIYDSTDGRGHLFYRNLKRAEVDGVPVVLVIDKPTKSIEEKIGRDRDRNAFGEAVLTLAYRQIASSISRNYEAQRILVERARGVWERGHPLLAQVAEKILDYRYNDRRWPRGLAAEVFGAGYYARSSSSDPKEQLEFSKIEQAWKEQGREPLPSYFRKFGVVDARSHHEDLRRKADEESKRRGKRAPTEAEWIGLRALSKITRELAPEIMAVFDRGTIRYDISSSEVLLGQLRRDRSYRVRDVFLSTKLFTSDFAEALAVFLHEHAHIFGYDGNRGFTDALTELIESIIRHRETFDRYEATWDRARKAVARERKATGDREGADELQEWIANSPEEELRTLVAMLPPLTLAKLRKRLGNGNTDPEGT